MQNNIIILYGHNCQNTLEVSPGVVPPEDYLQVAQYNTPLLEMRFPLPKDPPISMKTHFYLATFNYMYGKIR